MPNLSLLLVAPKVYENRETQYVEKMFTNEQGIFFEKLHHCKMYMHLLGFSKLDNLFFVSRRYSS